MLIHAIVVGGWERERERPDVDACHCTRGLYGHRKTVCAGSWFWGENRLAAPGTRTCLNITPGFFSQALSYPGPKYIPCRTATEVGSQRTCSINFNVDIQNGLRNRRKKIEKKPLSKEPLIVLKNIHIIAYCNTIHNLAKHTVALSLSKEDTDSKDTIWSGIALKKKKKKNNLAKTFLGHRNRLRFKRDIQTEEIYQMTLN